MSSLVGLINEVLPEFDKCKKITDIKKNNIIRLLTPCIIGGVSKLTAKTYESLKDALSKFSSDAPDYLDEYQREVVNAPVGVNMRILAGAGSGKTTTIVYRVKYLMKYLLPSDICILTFNRASKYNIVDKLHSVFGFNVNVPTMTIDSYAYKRTNSTFTTSRSEYCYNVTKLPSDVLEALSMEYKYVFFDEFQDVNKEQFEIIRNLSTNAIVTVIGDDYQNIYQFRGSDNSYIVNFDKLIPNVRTYMLLKNYRSSRAIVNAANNVILNNDDCIHKKLECTRDCDGEITVNICGHNATQEIKRVVSDIQLYTSNINNYKLSDIAVLSRNELMLRILETELTKHKIDHISNFGIDDINEYSTITKPRVVISTIHRAKGLEWKIVFLIGMLDEHFPSHVNNGIIKNIREERRLFYVAITRAKDILKIYSHDKSIDCKSHDNHQQCKIKHQPICRFLNEISEYVKDWNKIPDANTEMYSKNKIMTHYYVTNICRTFQSEHVISIKNNNLIPANLVHIRRPFGTTFAYSVDIKNYDLCADYGIFIQKYIIRRFRIGTIDCDYYVDKVLANNDHQKSSQNDSENYIVCPKSFIDNLNASYIDYKHNQNASFESIYYVSLCEKIINMRGRLMYRTDAIDIFRDQIIMMMSNIDKFLSSRYINNNAIFSRTYSDLFEICRVSLGRYIYHDCEEDDTNDKTCDECIDDKYWRHCDVCDKHRAACKISGIIDYICDGTLVDIKCSESEFNFEWLAQLFLYYSMMQVKPSKIAIVNILRGEYIEFAVDGYSNADALMDYIREYIIDNINGERTSVSIPNNSMDLHYTNPVVPCDVNRDNSSPIEWDRSDITYDYISIDIENNVYSGIITDVGIYLPDGQCHNWHIKHTIRDAKQSKICPKNADAVDILFEDMMVLLMDILSHTSCIIGYNIYTDLYKMLHNIHKKCYGYVSYWQRILNEYTIVDVLRSSKIMLSLPKYDLLDVYKSLFDDDIKDAHNPAVDAMMCAKIFTKLRYQ